MKLRLFGHEEQIEKKPKKGNITRENHRDIYYRNYFFPKNICEGIDKVALFQNTSKKDAAILLMEIGLRGYQKAMVEKMAETTQVGRVLTTEERIFNRKVRQLAAKYGIDLSKIFPYR
jgi:hypothetical protein